MFVSGKPHVRIINSPSPPLSDPHPLFHGTWKMFVRSLVDKLKCATFSRPLVQPSFPCWITLRAVSMETIYTSPPSLHLGTPPPTTTTLLFASESIFLRILSKFLSSLNRTPYMFGGECRCDVITFLLVIQYILPYKQIL